MDETHREFVECYNAVASAAPEDFVPAFDRLIAHTVAHFDLENGWMAAVDFPGCHRGEHDRARGQGGALGGVHEGAVYSARASGGPPRVGMASFVIFAARCGARGP